MVSLDGELDIAAAPELMAVLERAVSAVGPTELVVDLAEVTFCDVAGLRPLLAHERGALELRAPSPPLRRLLSLVRLVCPTVSSGFEGPGDQAATRA